MLLRVSAGDTGDLGKVGKQLNELKQHCRWTVARDSETEAETLLWFVPKGKQTAVMETNCQTNR